MFIAHFVVRSNTSITKKLRCGGLNSVNLDAWSLQHLCTGVSSGARFITELKGLASVRDVSVYTLLRLMMVTYHREMRPLRETPLEYINEPRYTGRVSLSYK